MFQSLLSRTGFRRQLTVVVSAGILLLALFSAVMNAWEASRRVESYLVQQGVHIADNLARQSTLAALYQSAENARDGVTATLAFPDVLHVEIRDSNDQVLLSLDKPGNKLRSAVHGHHKAPRGAALEAESDNEWYFGAPIYSSRTA